MNSDLRNPFPFSLVEFLFTQYTFLNWSIIMCRNKSLGYIIFSSLLIWTLTKIFFNLKK